MPDEPLLGDLKIHVEFLQQFGQPFRASERRPGWGSDEWASENFAAVIIGVRLTYEILSEALGYPATTLEVTHVVHPNASFSFRGLREPIDAVTDLLRRIPNLIEYLFTFQRHLRLKKTTLDADIREAEFRRASAELEVANVERLKRESAASAEVSQVLALAKREAELAKALAAKAMAEAQTARAMLVRAESNAKAFGIAVNHGVMSRLKTTGKKARSLPQPERRHVLAEALNYELKSCLPTGPRVLVAVAPTRDKRPAKRQ